MKAKLFTDGGSRGNPGPAAYAFVLEAEHGAVLCLEDVGGGRRARIAACPTVRKEARRHRSG